MRRSGVRPTFSGSHSTPRSCWVRLLTSWSPRDGNENETNTHPLRHVSREQSLHRIRLHVRLAGSIRPGVVVDDQMSGVRSGVPRSFRPGCHSQAGGERRHRDGSSPTCSTRAATAGLIVAAASGKQGHPTPMVIDTAKSRTAAWRATTSDKNPRAVVSDVYTHA